MAEASARPRTQRPLAAAAALQQIRFMDNTAVPFVTKYGTTGLDALGKPKLEMPGGSTIVIGSFAAEVEVRGLIRLEPDALVLEYRNTKAMVLSFVAPPNDGELHTVRIPIAAVESITVKSALFGKPKIVIEFSRLDVLPSLPWSETTRLVLPIEKRDRDRGREIAVTLQNRLADAQLKQLGEAS